MKTKIVLSVGKPAELWEYEKGDLEEFPVALVLIYDKKEKELGEGLEAFLNRLAENRLALLRYLDNYDLRTYQVLIKNHLAVDQIIGKIQGLNAKLVEGMYGASFKKEVSSEEIKKKSQELLHSHRVKS